MNLFNEILDFTNYKPLGLNYYGAKKLIAPQIFQLMHKRHFKRHGKKAEYFLDCFGGGGSMSLAALQFGYKAIYNELRPDLCLFFKDFKWENPKKLPPCDLAEWKKIAKTPRDERDFMQVAKLLFYSFNFGMERKGYSTQNYTLAEPFFEALRGLNFQNLWIRNSNYKDLNIYDFKPHEIMIYADIPYQDAKSKASYKGVYDERFEIGEFCEWCEDLRGRGYEVFVSEYNAPSDDFTELLSVKKGLMTNPYEPNGVRYEKIFVLKDSENERQAI
jgi:hypothetical protein